MTKPEYVGDGSTAESRVAREGYRERKNRENPLQLKLRDHVQGDEQKKINKHSEGFCYGCNKVDYILSSLFYICQDCMHKRGHEGLLAIVYQKPGEELCDFCGRWSKPFDCWQVNVSMCNSCMGKIKILHEKYRKSGGREQNPLTRRLRKKYGKDYTILMKSPARKLNI